MIGTKNIKSISNVLTRTIEAAVVLFIFVFSQILSTIGFSEHEITKDAKNNIAMSLI